MPKRPTLQDVAAAVGLAPATVSYALRGERGSVETVRRVREAAAALGYQVDPIASALASGRTRTVAVLAGSARDSWQQALVPDLSRALQARGRHAIVADADGDAAGEEELLAMLRAQRPDGFLVVPLDPFAAHWRPVEGQAPMVALGDRLTQAPEAGTVVFDNDAGMALVFDHLAGLGHRRVAVVVPQRPSTPDRPTELLVEQHAERCRVEARLVRVPPATSDPDATTGRLADALAGPERPTAVFCLADSFAHGALRAASRLGLAVPGDLSISGFEHHDLSDLVGPGLTTVDWGREAVVDAAVGQLLAAIDDDEPLRTITIAPRLVVRGSTGPAPR